MVSDQPGRIVKQGLVLKKPVTSLPMPLQTFQLPGNGGHPVARVNETNVVEGARQEDVEKVITTVSHDPGQVRADVGDTKLVIG